MRPCMHACTNHGCTQPVLAGWVQSRELDSDAMADEIRKAERRIRDRKRAEAELIRKDVCAPSHACTRAHTCVRGRGPVQLDGAEVSGFADIVMA